MLSSLKPRHVLNLSFSSVRMFCYALEIRMVVLNLWGESPFKYHFFDKVQTIPCTVQVQEERLPPLVEQTRKLLLACDSPRWPSEHPSAAEYNGHLTTPNLSYRY